MNKRLNKILASAMSAVMIFGGTINPAIGGLAVHADDASTEAPDATNDENESEDYSAEAETSDDEAQAADTGGVSDDSADAADAEAAVTEAPADGNETEQVPSTDEAQSQLGQNTEAAPADKADDFSSGRLIAITDDKSVFANDNAVISKYGDLYLLKYDSEEDAKQAYDSYKDQVKYIEPDVNVYSCDDQDKAEDTEGLSIEEGSTPLDAVKENESASLKKTLKSIKKTNSDKTVIALLDSGVHIDQHTSAENLAGSIDLTNSTDSGEYSHGDLMYSTIINEDPDASIVDVKVLGDDGIGSISSVAAGLAYAIDKDVDIINLSLSAYKTEENSVILSLIDEACDKGITVVGAAGNNRSDASKFVPGASEKAVIVNACDGDGKMRDFSNYGTTVDYSVEAGSTSEAAAKMTGILSKNMKKGVDPFSSLPSEVHTPEAVTTSEDGTGYIDSTGAFHAAGNMIDYVTCPYHYEYYYGKRTKVEELTEDYYVSVPSGAGTYQTPGYTPSSVTFTDSDTNTTKDVIRHVYRSANDVDLTPHNWTSHKIYLHPNGGSADNITNGGGSVSLTAATKDGEAVKYCYTNSNQDLLVSNDYATMQDGFDKITVTRTGYIFLGWYTEATGGTQVTKANSKIRSDMDIYAHWREGNTVTVTFDKTGGTGGTDSIKAKECTDMPAITVPARDGYTFLGYYDDRYEGKQYYKVDGTPTGQWDKPDDTTLYAHWQFHEYSHADSSTGKMVDFVIPSNGTYKFTIVGGAGGDGEGRSYSSSSSDLSGGKGHVVEFVDYFKKDTKFAFNIGGNGQSGSAAHRADKHYADGGYNNGVKGKYITDDDYSNNRTGGSGGHTDVYLYDTSADGKTLIATASGGKGGDAGGYYYSWKETDHSGPAGGQFNDSKADWVDSTYKNQQISGAGSYSSGTVIVTRIDSDDPYRGYAYAVYNSTTKELDFVRSYFELTLSSKSSSSSSSSSDPITGSIMNIDGSTYAGSIWAIDETTTKATEPGYITYNRNYSDNVAANTKIVKFIDGVHPKSTAYWFDNFKSCKQYDLKKLNTANAENMTYMFAYFPGEILQDAGINLKNIKVASGANLNDMFYGSSLVRASVGSLDVSKAGSLVYMFANSTKLREIDMTGWNTANVTSMSYMFHGCSSLSKMTFGDGFITKSSYASDVFPTPTTTYSGEKSSGDWGLGSETLEVEFKDTEDNTKTAAKLGEYAEQEGKLKGTWYAQKKKPTAYALFTDTAQTVNGVAYPAGSLIFLRSYDTNYSSTKGITSVSGGTYKYRNLYSDDFENKDPSQSSYDVRWNDKRSDIKAVYFVDKIRPVHPYGWFYNCKNATTMDVDKLDMSRAESVYMMFSGDSNLKSLNTKSWSLPKVTECRHMFSNCTNLTSLDASNWGMSKATDCEYMFDGCTKLASLDVSNWNMSSVTDCRYMFQNCSSLDGIDTSKWGMSFDSSASNPIDYMFDGCSSLKTFDGSGIDTKGLAKLQYVFQNCSKLSDFSSISKWDVSSVDNFQYLFAGTAIKNCDDIHDWKVATGSRMKDHSATFTGMFKDCSKLTDAAVLNDWNITTSTCKGIDGMNFMFENCPKLEKVDISSWDGSILGEHVWDVSAKEIFYGDKSLRYLKLGAKSTLYYYQEGRYYDTSGTSTNYRDPLIYSSFSHFDRTDTTGDGDPMGILHVTEPSTAAPYTGQWTKNSPFNHSDAVTAPNLCQAYDDPTSTTKEAATWYWEIEGQGLSFDANGGTGTMDPEVFTTGEAKAITKNAFTRKGYKFTSWNTKADGTGTKYTDGQEITLDESMILYAQWEIQPNKITLDANNGTGGQASTEATYGKAMTALTSLPSRKGYDFAGYYDDSDNSKGTQYYKADGSPAVSTWDKKSDTTLYAHWSAKTYTATLDPKNGVNPLTVTAKYDDKWGSLPTPTKVGYTFAGWFTADGNEVTSDTICKGDASLSAKYTAETYQSAVNLKNTDGSLITTINVTYDSEMPAVSDLSKLASNPGYQLTGFKEQGDQGTKYYKYDQAKKQLVSNHKWNKDLSDGTKVDLYPVWEYEAVKVTIPTKISISKANVGKLSKDGKDGLPVDVKVIVDNKAKRTVNVKTTGGELVSKDKTSKLTIAGTQGVTFNKDDTYKSDGTASKNDVLTISGTAKYQSYSGAVTYNVTVASGS